MSKGSGPSCAPLRKWLLDRLYGYAKEKARKKRSLGTYFAVLSIVVLGHPNCGQSDGHVSVEARLNALWTVVGGGALATPDLIVRETLNGIRRVWPSAPTLAA